MIIVIGFQAGEDNTFNVFLEYVAGGSIASVLSKCGKFDENIARSVIAQILCGLEYLHSRDIIHRDIKGANSMFFILLIDVFPVLVTGDGIIKISDFGISKKNGNFSILNSYSLFYVEHTAYHRMTRMSMQGSINWMAPEVARGKGYSAKVDIWSCGCLLLEILTGQLPWHNVRGNVIYLLGTGNAPPLPSTLSDIAKHFLEESFTIDPEARPTATKLLNHMFTDVDISAIDFQRWVDDAMALRAEMGSTSEEVSTESSEDDSSEDEEDSEDDETDHLDQVSMDTPSSNKDDLDGRMNRMKVDEFDSDDDDDYLYDNNEVENLDYLLNPNSGSSRK